MLCVYLCVYFCVAFVVGSLQGKGACFSGWPGLRGLGRSPEGEKAINRISPTRMGCLSCRVFFTVVRVTPGLAPAALSKGPFARACAHAAHEAEQPRKLPHSSSFYS